jgi:hypothetical protein
VQARVRKLATKPRPGPRTHELVFSPLRPVVLQDVQRAVGGMVVRGPDAPIGVGLGGYGIELAGRKRSPWWVQRKIATWVECAAIGAGPGRERDGANFTRCSGATRPGRRHLRCRVNSRISPNGTGGTAGKVLQLTIYGGMAISMVMSVGVPSHRGNRCPGPFMPPNPRCDGTRVTRPARATETGRELSDSPWHTPT